MRSMTIKKFTGKTKEEAIAAAKQELGSQVVIMNIKEQKQHGLFGMFKAPVFEVTAAIEEDITQNKPASFTKPAAVEKPESNGFHFDAVADENISLQNTAVNASPVADSSVSPANISVSPANHPAVNENDLKSAFREISEMVEKSEKKSQSSLNNENHSPVKEESNRFVSLGEMAKVKEQQPISSTPLNKTATLMNHKEQLNFLKMLYNILMDNEVDEKYVNQILDDLDNVLTSGSSLDYLISNVYQKLVLKFGKPNVISLSEKKPKIVFIIGPTGVGKTTTIAKIASKFKIEKKKNVAFITTDTYRIAATDQLNVYADILSSPVSIVYDINDFNNEVAKYSDMDLVLVDTAGFSHKNQTQKDELKKLLSLVSEDYEKEIYLVLSATTKYHDLKEIVDTYKSFTDFKIIFTKLDETGAYGNILNMKLYTQADLSYVTTGQNVPDDIEVVDSQKIVKQLLGGQ